MKRRCGGSGMQEEGPTEAGSQGTSGAHLKHDVHVCDLGRVEEQRLVER